MSSTRLIVLGMLSRQPMHGYQIQKALEQSQADRWAALRPGSIYHALNKLTEEGLLRLEATESRGLQQRGVYAITAAGTEELTRLVRRALSKVPRPYPVALFAAAGLLSVLSLDERRERLERLAAQIHEEMDSWARGREEKQRAFQQMGHASLSPELELVFESAIAHLEVDMRMVCGLLDALGPDPHRTTGRERDGGTRSKRKSQ